MSKFFKEMVVWGAVCFVASLGIYVGRNIPLIVYSIFGVTFASSVLPTIAKRAILDAFMGLLALFLLWVSFFSPIRLRSFQRYKDRWTHLGRFVSVVLAFTIGAVLFVVLLYDIIYIFFLIRNDTPVLW